MFALAAVADKQDAIALFAQREAHGIGVALGGQARAGLRVTQVASGFQFFLRGAKTIVAGSGAGTGPSSAEGEAMGKGPGGVEWLVGHEEGAGQSVLSET